MKQMHLSSIGSRHSPTIATKTVLLLSGSMTIMGSVMVAPVIPQIIAHFSGNEGAALLVQLAITGPALAISVFSPLAGMLADVVGRKRLLVLATFFYAFLGAAPTLIQHLPWLVATRVLFGVAEAVVMTCVMTLIGEYWQGSQRLGVINLQVITIGLIGTALYLLGGWVGEDEWRNPFLLYLVPILLIPLMKRFLFEPERPYTGKHPSSQVQHALKWKPLLSGYSAIFFGMILAFVVPIQSPFLLMSLGIHSTLDFAALSAWSLFISLAGSLIWPYMLRHLGVAVTHGVTFILFSGAIWLMCRADSYQAMLVAVTLHGVACGIFPPNAMAPVMASLTDQTRAKGMGCFTSLLYFGQFLSPVLVAILVRLNTDLRAGLNALAIISVFYAAAWIAAAVMARFSSSIHQQLGL
ncbi:MFS transporter [Pseudomonas sp. S75]|uniref:MFS transporter n=1 Tax=unclassified Pseudomonas TaxID=196821 RepID=UPI001904F93D|nr:MULTISPECIES: MFS transporter [unclassified Pseudomonas]MBJ9974191.1 MFS transporter [Pseudomonas sp. S30]MBK0151879.1 MFS transporter [Pseudomonas sp. S75]